MIIIRGVFIISSPLRHPALLLRVPPPLPLCRIFFCSYLASSSPPTPIMFFHAFRLPASPSDPPHPVTFLSSRPSFKFAVPNTFPSNLLPLATLDPAPSASALPFSDTHIPYLTYYYLFAFSIRKDPGVPDMMLSLSAAPLGLSASTPFASICKS